MTGYPRWILTLFFPSKKNNQACLLQMGGIGLVLYQLKYRSSLFTFTVPPPPPKGIVFSHFGQK